MENWVQAVANVLDYEKKPQTKINFIEAHEWRWTTDEGEKWHTSFIIDFECNGKRYMLLKSSVVYCHGGEYDEKGFKDLLKQYQDDKEKNSGHGQERRELPTKTEIAVPATRYVEDGLWDMARTVWGKEQENPIVTPAFWAMYEKGVQEPVQPMDEQSPKPKEETPKNPLGKPFEAYTDMELHWFGKIFEKQGDAISANAVKAEWERRRQGLTGSQIQL